jgi:hypothetical protein
VLLKVSLFELVLGVIIGVQPKKSFVLVPDASGSSNSGVRSTKMRTRIVLLTLLLNSHVSVDSLAQGMMPFVYQIENTGADYPKPTFPSFSNLPAIQALPDPFEWSDGRGRVSNFSDWRYRRAEIGAQIQEYEIGPKPVRPDTITASYAGGVLTVIVTVNGKTLTLKSQVILPAGTGPFPAVIGMNSPSGSVPSTVFSSRNIAQITFSRFCGKVPSWE